MGGSKSEESQSEGLSNNTDQERGLLPTVEAEDISYAADIRQVWCQDSA